MGEIVFAVFVLGVCLILRRTSWQRAAYADQPCLVCGDQIHWVDGRGWIHYSTNDPFAPITEAEQEHLDGLDIEVDTDEWYAMLAAPAQEVPDIHVARPASWGDAPRDLFDRLG